MRKYSYNLKVDSVWVPTKKTASQKASEHIDIETEIPDDITFSPDFVYSTVRAVSNRINLNMDGFEKHQLLGAINDLPPHNDKYGYRTFLGKNNHIDHNNQPELAEFDPRHNPRGTILWSSYHEGEFDEPVMLRTPDGTIEDPVSKQAGHDSWVKLLIANDRRRFPVLAEAIESKVLDRVSMGAEIIDSSCTVCGNAARAPFEYCSHVRDGGRGRLHVAQMSSPLVTAGVIQAGEPMVGAELNNGLEFFEISWITDQQADETALLRDILYGEPGMSLREIENGLVVAKKVAALRDRKLALEEEGGKPPVRVQIDGLPEKTEEKPEDADEKGDSDEIREDFDEETPPHEQGGGPFMPETSFICGAKKSAAEANPEYPIDPAIDIKVCLGCIYNKDDRVGVVNCGYDKVAREGGKDPLPPGFQPPDKAETDYSSGFYNDDGTPIKEFPGIKHPYNGGDAEEIKESMLFRLAAGEAPTLFDAVDEGEWVDEQPMLFGEDEVPSRSTWAPQHTLSITVPTANSTGEPIEGGERERVLSILKNEFNASFGGYTINVRPEGGYRNGETDLVDTDITIIEANTDEDPKRLYKKLRGMADFVQKSLNQASVEFTIDGQDFYT